MGEGIRIVSYSGEEMRVEARIDQVTFQSVSYTHLDVYKRQPMYSATLYRTRANSMMAVLPSDR